MKKFKGTKGEWIAHEDATGHSIFTDRDLICRTHNKPTIVESKANAQLIATAPLLLKEIQRVIQLAEDMIEHIHNQSTHPENNEVIMFDVDAIVDAKQTINKSLGL